MQQEGTFEHHPLTGDGEMAGVLAKAIRSISVSSDPVAVEPTLSHPVVDRFAEQMSGCLRDEVAPMPAGRLEGRRGSEDTLVSLTLISHVTGSHYELADWDGQIDVLWAFVEQVARDDCVLAQRAP